MSKEGWVDRRIFDPCFSFLVQNSPESCRPESVHCLCEQAGATFYLEVLKLNGLLYYQKSSSVFNYSETSHVAPSRSLIRRSATAICSSSEGDEVCEIDRQRL